MFISVQNQLFNLDNIRRIGLEKNTIIFEWDIEHRYVDFPNEEEAQATFDNLYEKLDGIDL